MDNQETWTAESLEDFLLGSTLQERSTEFCGGRHVVTSVEGVMNIKFHRCGLHRTCQFCYDIRRNEFESKLTNDSNPKDLIAIVFDEEDAKRLLKSRKISSSDYLRSPLLNADGKVIIAISKEIADSANVEYDQWTYVVDENGNVDSVIVDSFAGLPEGKRSSGNLGKKLEPRKLEDTIYPQPENDDDVLSIDLPRCLTNGSDDRMLSELFMDAIKASSDKRPSTAEELADCHYKRMSIFRGLLAQNGMDSTIIGYSHKTLSLKWALENFVTIQEIKPHVQITLNSTIGQIVSPIAKELKDIICRELGVETLDFTRIT